MSLFIRASIVGNICRICHTPCAHQHDVSFQSDPCATCPLSPPAWGKFDCGVTDERPEPAPRTTLSPAPIIPPIVPRGPSALRFVRAWKAHGSTLIHGPVRRARRDACAGCQYRVETGHRGLYACGVCKTCGGNTDAFRLLRPIMSCSQGRWKATDG